MTSRHAAAADLISVDLPLMFGAVRRNSPSRSNVFATPSLRSIQCGESDSNRPADVDGSALPSSPPPSSPSTIRPTLHPLALEEEA